MDKSASTEEWHSEPPARIRGAVGSDRLLFVAAVAAPVLTSLVLIPWRGRLDTADSALFLVVVIVAVASTGRRMAALVAAITAALAFDYFLTRPYYSFRISGHQDLITEVLLLVVGVAVGELAARGRNHRRDAVEGRRTMAHLHSVTELAATGREPELVIRAALEELIEQLSLRHCYFTRHDPGSLPARVTPDGAVIMGGRRWPTEDLGIPTGRVDLPVRAQGWLLGHFVLTPTPGRAVAGHQLLSAVSLADLVGTVLLAQESELATIGREDLDHGSPTGDAVAGGEDA